MRRLPTLAALPALLLPLSLGLSLGCRSSSPREAPGPKPETSGSATPATTPEAKNDAKDQPKAEEKPLSEEEKAKQRDERAKSALARLPEIEKGLAKLRQLELRSEVPGEMQSTEDFRKFLKTSIDAELPVDRADAIATAYAQLGLLEKKVDLRKTLEDAMVSQAGAYYDPKAKKFFMVMVPSQDLMFDTISAHELTHALQDQHFDLQAYYDQKKDKQLVRLGNDSMNARRFIVEGEATLTMMAYIVGAMTKKDPMSPELRPMLEMQLKAAAKMGIEELRAATKQQQSSSFVDLDEDQDIVKAIEAMDDIPLVLMLPLLESYMRGALPVFAAFQQGGWKEVNNLYKQPPESTEQVLHPETKLFPTRDLPKVVTLPKPPAGYQQVYSDTIGELEWRVYFLLWEKASSDAAAAGWDGDRYAVLRGKGGDLVTLQVTTWDSEAEAQEFEAAYRKSLIKRFGGDGSKRPEGSPVRVERKGSDVFIVDGADADKLMPTLIKGTKIQAL